MPYCTPKKRTQDHHSIAQAQRERDKHEHGVAKQSRAHEHSAAAAAAVAPSGTRATLDSSSTRTPELLSLFYCCVLLKHDEPDSTVLVQATQYVVLVQRSEK